MPEEKKEVSGAQAPEAEAQGLSLSPDSEALSLPIKVREKDLENFDELLNRAKNLMWTEGLEFFFYPEGWLMSDSIIIIQFSTNDYEEIVDKIAEIFEN